MTEDIVTEAPAPAGPPKAKKKAAAKKVARKAAPKAKAAAPVDVEKPKPTRKPPARKKAAPAAPAEAQGTLPLDVGSSAQHAANGAMRAEAAAAPAPTESAPPPPPQSIVAEAVAPAPDQPAPAPTPEPPQVQAAQAEPRHTARADAPTEGQPQQHPQERRKSKFERWKERRERFRQERLARQQQQGTQPRDNQPADGDDLGREPEKPLGPPEPAEGILEMTPKGYGFLRQRDRMFAQHPNDAFIAPELIRKFGLREGMQVKGVQQKGHRGMQVTEVAEVNGRVPESMRDLPLFEELKAINPNKKIQLETVKDRLTTRVIDMITPVGRGQRGLIVAPPRAGKTTLLQHIAEAIVDNHPAMHLMILLVDERPEEVTEFKRILPKAEIFASSNDQDVKSHTRISSFCIERAKRLVECGEHVFILLDSITRLARAFNNSKSGGATMSGGMGVGAMEIPRRLFAAARNTRQAGSLTILATALIETGSRMDDLIFQEFKGTGNMELVLDRKIAEQYIYPAVNIFKSGTRREELLLQPFQLDKIHMLRRGLAGHKPIEAIQRVISLLERYPNNAQMLVDLPSKAG
jgi:transcription termination factor Rho